MKNVNEIFKLLKKRYPGRKFFSDTHTTPYKVLISTILSQRTKDANTLKAAKALFKLADTPQKILMLKPSAIQKAIRPSGFYKNKTKTILKATKQLLEGYEGKVPKSKDKLLKLAGVGPKTASCVLLFGYKIPQLPVDVHVFIISRRLGWSNKKTPHEVEQDLEKRIPKKYWMDLNELLVRFGQDVCLTRNPKCSICPLTKYCKYYKNKK
ncbi:MAG: endonuclease III [Nanoarchaeota archaeon]|nr:endonuclease III [Nanoarchaeota archaeon]